MLLVFWCFVVVGIVGFFGVGFGAGDGIVGAVLVLVYTALEIDVGYSVDSKK